MNNFCRNCGEKLDSDVKVCPKCNAEVFEERVNIEQKTEELKKYKKKENKYIISVITLYVLANLLSLFSLSYYFLSYIGTTLNLAALITLITARITMHQSTKIKVMFNIIIGLTVLYTIYVIVAIVACVNSLSRC